MSLSYSALTNFGKVTLPSLESWGTNMNILRDPPKSITTRRVDKVGQNNDITTMIDDSGNRASEAILQYARGVNPFVSVSYSNEGNNGGQRSNGLAGTMNSGGRAAFLPYRVMRDGAFRPPLVRQENLMPLSRQPRVWTTAFTQPGFADFSKKMVTCGTAENTKEVKTTTLKLNVAPTAVYNMSSSASKPIEVKYVIQNPIKVSAGSGIKTLDITQQEVKAPTKGIDDDLRYAYAQTNANNDREYFNSSEFDSDRFIQDGLKSSAVSNMSSHVQITPITDILDLSNIKTKDAMNVEYHTQLSGVEQTNYIHGDISLQRNLPEHDMKTNIGKNIHKKVDSENEIELDRNLPLTYITSNNTMRGGSGTNDNISARNYKLIPKISAGGFEGKQSKPVEGRTNQNVFSADNTRKVLSNKRINDSFSRFAQ